MHPGKSTRKRWDKSGNRKLRLELEHFICVNSDFNKRSYGEIQFKGYGSRSTYAPFVTCSPTTNPQTLWRLLTHEWRLTVPNIVISVAGEFEKRDYEWLNVMNETWLFTNGSSPTHQTSYNSCSIAIMEMNSVQEKQALYGRTTQGLFPAVYQVGGDKKAGERLDQTHTHFIFVEGDASSTADFRAKLIFFIGSIPVEMDTGATSFATVPVLNVLISDDTEALMNMTRFEQGPSDEKCPLVVTKTASRMIDILQQAQKSEFEAVSSSKNKLLRMMTSCIDKTEQNKIEKCLNEIFLRSNEVTIYTTAEKQHFPQVLLKAVMSCDRFGLRSKIRLAMSWNCMDALRMLLYSRKQFEGEEDYTSTYLVMALSLDRAEFLEYLQELGVNIYSKLTVKTLWTLYYESLYNDQFETDTSFILKKLLLHETSSGASDLLQAVGRVISRLTKREVAGLYADQIYRHHSEKVNTLRKKRTTLRPIDEDDSPIVPYPERDLFLWCILLGKSNLALVFWRNGYNFITSALIASSILQGEASAIDFKTHDSALAEELNENAKFWSQTAIDFLAASFRAQKGATMCQLTQKLSIYGGCSALYLAYVAEQKYFIAEPASQSALDYIWLGKTKKDHSKWKTLIALICPFAVPFLNIVDRTNHFVPTVSQVYQSTFTDTKEEQQNEQESGIGGVVNMIQNLSEPSDNDRRYSSSKKQLSRFTKYTQEIFYYFDSPKTKFMVHSMYLVVTIILMSFALIIHGSQTLGSTYNVPSLLVFLYMCGLLIDEVRQLLSEDNATGCGKLKLWISDSWNRLDFIMVACYFAGEIILWNNVQNCNLRYAAKFLFAISLLGMYMRCFQIYLVFPYLGPKIYMMRQMMKDLLTFLSIMALVFLCYGVILSTLLNESNKINDFDKITSFSSFLVVSYNTLLRAPYWQIFGNELANAVNPQPDLEGVLESLVTAFYLLFSNILMVNLLIAMFSYTFQNIQDNANVYWKFHRFEVVREFWDRPWLASPFIIIEDLVRAIMWFRNKKVQAHAFKRLVTKEQEILLWDFEKEIQLKVATRDQEEKHKDLSQ